MSAALDQIAELYQPVPVGTQFMGRARDIRCRVEREDDAYMATINALVDPIMARLRRHPDRSLRQQMLVDLLRDWSHMEARDWRLSCDAKLDKGRAYLREVRLCAGKLKRGDWDDAENDISATEFTVTIDRNRARLQGRCLACFSLHAISRRLQRHPDGATEALLYDMNLAAVAACGALTLGAGYKVTTDSMGGGGWRGRVVMLAGAVSDATAVPTLSIRTWME